MILLLLACAGSIPTSPMLSMDRTIDRTPIQGTVAQVLEAGSYQYIEVDGLWHATLRKDVAVGQAVTLTPMGRMAPFTSRALDRTFDAVLFSTLAPAAPRSVTLPQ